MEITADGHAHALGAGDCLRFRLMGVEMTLRQEEIGGRMRYVLMLCGDASAGDVQDGTAMSRCGECANLDEAIEVAAKHPWASLGKIEIRPVWQP
ncbi:hypothetical protein [Nonomuraea cavernae]|uniref:hypothetical protein n=1 Tax=Nonomuraea cavernae TaxID=2045107 RepID=UPI0033D77761